MTLFSDPSLPCFVIQCQGIDFPLGEITNQTKVDLRQGAGWTNLSSLQYLLKINYLPYLFSLSTFPWIGASLSLLIFSLSQCLELVTKALLFKDPCHIVHLYTQNKFWLKLDIRIHLKKRSWWSWNSSREIMEKKQDCSPTNCQHFQHGHLTSLLPSVSYLLMAKFSTLLVLHQVLRSKKESKSYI